MARTLRILILLAVSAGLSSELTDKELIAGEIRQDLFPPAGHDARREEYGCYGRPKGCDCRSNCSLLAEWRGISKDTYQVILSGGQADGYLAIGWPTVGDMGPAPVVVCANGVLAAGGDNDPHTGNTALYWNQVDSSSPAAVPDELLANVSVAVVDGQLKCSFELKSSFEVNNVTRDLNAEGYYVIVATGSVDTTTGQILPHTKENRGHSPEPLFWADANGHLVWDYSGCGTTVGCEGLPMGCVVGRNCSQLVRFEGAAEDSYGWTMAGQAVKGDISYLAVALSTDTAMGDDSVVACVAEVGVVMYVNGVYQSTPLPNTTVGVSHGKVELVDGMISCSFLLQANYSIEKPKRGSSRGSTRDSLNFDLNSRLYHVMLAAGPTSNNLITQHTIRDVTAQPVNLAQFNPFINATTTSPGPTTTATITTTTAAPPSNSSVYEGCYDTKGCFGAPEGCVDRRNCDYLATYSRTEEDRFRFEIEVDTAQASTYGALGLSFDNRMGDDSVMACTLAADGSSVDVAMYWNVAEPGYNSLPLVEAHFGLSHVVGSVEDGQLWCSFEREPVTEVPRPDKANETVRFDLGEMEFYLFLASGSLGSDGRLIKHKSTIKSAKPVVISI